MISVDEFYKVMCAMVPLYVAMLLAYSSLKWWKIFSPEQCSGINRFVTGFAIPVLSFHFISQNNPYQIDTKFIFADTLSKLLVLVLLSLWAIIKGGFLDWFITLFSISTLPNTIVMGIPLLKAMYGDLFQSFMVQLVVLQCVIWNNLLLFLFEYRAATILIQNQFPGSTAASITKFDIDGDVISLDGRDPLCTESKIDANGHIQVRIRRSTSILSDSTPSVENTHSATNLSSADIFSINTPAPMHEFHGNNDITLGYRSSSPRLSGYTSSDAYSLQPTPPRASNFNELDIITLTTTNTPTWVLSPVAGKVFRQQSPALTGVKVMWESPGNQIQNVGCGGEGQECRDVGSEMDLSFRVSSKFPAQEEEYSKDRATNQEMPRAFVMLRLILIMTGRKLSRNPNIYAIVFGLLWSLISFKWNVGMPNLVKYSIKLISDSGFGMAMFSLGLFMALQTRIIACSTKMATMGMAIRLVVGPVLMSATSFAVGLRGTRLHAAIVQAALPQGILPFVFATEYGLHTDILSTGVTFGILVSLPVTLLYYILLSL